MLAFMPLWGIGGMNGDMIYAMPAVIIVILYPRSDFHHVTQTGAYTGGLFDGKIRVPFARVNTFVPRVVAVLDHMRK